MGTRWGTSVYMSASSISTIAKTVIKSINEGDTLTAVSLPASTFHENTVKLASVLLSKKLGGIYVTTSRPSSHITAELEAAKADLSDLYFVDLVSMTVGGNTSDPRTLFIESPTMLESILLNITLLERRLKAKRRFVMFDSVNGLSIYSEPKVLREFINVLGNSMRIKEIYSMLMTVTEQTDEDLNSALDLLSDKIIR
jgi:KaiC/GvpD/RAD55 family RecA-like ATPase